MPAHSPTRRPGHSAAGTAFRFACLLALVFALASVATTAVARAVQPPMPPLLYTRGSELHLLRAECPDWTGACAYPDRVLLDNLDYAQAVAQWSPDGDTIAAHLDAGWALYAADCLLRGEGRRCRAVPLDGDRTDIRLAWGPNGTTVAYSVNSGTLLRLKTSGCWTGPAWTCRTWEILTPLNLLQPAWSADGRWMAFGGAPHGAFMLDTACLNAPETCADALRPYTTNPHQLDWPSLSADGHLMLFERYDSHAYRQIFLANLHTGEQRQLTFRHYDAMYPAWSADERYVAFTALDGAGALANLNIYLFDLARGLTALAVGAPDNDTFPAWGVSGR